ncbi:hypothetical protein [Actinoplanes sp. NBRC 103695]|uniref:hypothetical protein n=1 Tax=Actinoplanes sp. NBRC 103695 TaxID=3032202 RepID=UPI0024A48FF1|nr:hypothetical protein [Actinoplanes sp. NBRC 103695]GLY96171.1 hypothetical protein Acsp02_34260 [Actinoplanes sp. NBRC 103695]
MDIVLTILVVTAVFGAVLLALVWLARRVRRSGSAAHVMGPIDLIYNPGAARWRPEVEQHEQRIEPSAGDSAGRRQRQPLQDP